MESITKYFKEENDPFYIKGKQTKEYEFVISLLKETDFSVEKIATLAGVEVQFVEKVKEEQKSKIS